MISFLFIIVLAYLFFLYIKYVIGAINSVCFNLNEALIISE